MHIQFDFETNYELADDRVVLRPLQLSDYSHLLPFSLNEPDLWRFSLTSAAGEDNLKKYMATALQSRMDAKEYPFIVWDKLTGEYAGCTRLYDIQLAAKTWQLGYTWYGKKFQGTGLNKHCKYLLLQFAFDKIGMERVEFRADNTNERSIAAMLSIGCIKEGVLRSHTLKPDGSRRDSIVLSILKREWEGSVKKLLAEKLG